MLLGGACKKEVPPAPPPQKAPLTTSHKTFTNDEYLVVAAATERMIPKDEDPGAVELGVPEYIDRMLQDPLLQQMKDDFLAGTAALDRRAKRMFKVGFAQATSQQQDELLTIFKDSAPGTGEAHYYELLMVLTLEGLLGDPSYGGNKDRGGWKLVGFNLIGKQAIAPLPGYSGQEHLHKHKQHGSH